jgi:hypothetical protein
VVHHRLASVVWWMLTCRRIMRRRMLVWCIVGVVVVRSRSVRRRMCVVVWLRRRRMFVKMCAHCNHGFALGTLHYQSGFGTSLPECEKLMEWLGCCGGELEELHGGCGVVVWCHFNLTKTYHVCCCSLFVNNCTADILTCLEITNFVHVH